jgi:alcohol dehydrogenase YqhD (iron-dependent ADH family)
MRASIAMSAALAIFAFSLAGCSPESKAKDTLEKYENLAFKICKEETEKMKMKPGEHQCAYITSMALDMSLKDSGLEEAQINKMREEWLDKSGYRAYYIPKEKRKPEHQ